MTDNGFCFVFVLVYKLLCTGERDLVDIAIHLLSCHADTVIADGQGFLRFVEANAYAQVAQVALGFTHRRQGLQLLRRIYGVTDQLTQKDLVIAVQKFLDDGEYIVRRHANITFTHIVLY